MVQQLAGRAQDTASMRSDGAGVGAHRRDDEI